MKININIKLLTILLLQLFNLSVQPGAYADEREAKNLSCNKESLEMRTLGESHVLYLRVDSLCENLTKLLGDAMREFFRNHPPESMVGTVLDLRHTQSIGTAGAVIGVASVFINPDTLLTTNKGKDGKYYPVKTGKPYYQGNNDADYLRDLPEFLLDAPLAVLVGQDTKNAPEFLAAAFLSIRNAFLVGDEFADGVGNPIDLHNPFYQLIAPMLSISKLDVSEARLQQKMYMAGPLANADADANSCTEEQLAILRKEYSQAIKKSGEVST